MRQAVAQLGTRDDSRAHLAEVLVPAGVIAMHVSVDHEFDGLASGNLFDGRGDLPAQGRELASTMNTPSGPVSTPMVPPWPSSV